MSIRIGMGNGHNKPSVVRMAERSGCDSFCGMEVQKLVPEFRAIPNTRLTIAGEAFAEELDRAKSTLIVTSNSLENLGQTTLKVSERVESHLKFGPDRIEVVSCFAHPVARRAGWDGVAHIGLHPNATVRNRDANHPLVREYRESMETLKRTVRFYQGQRLLPIVTGDLQMTVADDDVPWAPMNALVRDLNMEFVAHKIDWILWHKSLRQAGRVRLVELYDHKGMIVDLRIG